MAIELSIVLAAVPMGPEGRSENGEQQLDQRQAQQAEAAEQREGRGHRQPPRTRFLKQSLRGWGFVAKPVRRPVGCCVTAQASDPWLLAGKRGFSHSDT
jgi:hypothetical protein